MTPNERLRNCEEQSLMEQKPIVQLLPRKGSLRIWAFSPVRIEYLYEDDVYATTVDRTVAVALMAEKMEKGYQGRRCKACAKVWEQAHRRGK